MISVIIPSFNSAHLLPRAVNSIQSQTFTDWEIVIVDDCSTDSTSQTISTLKSSNTHITSLKTDKNSGPISAFNLGASNCHGDLICQLDADDWFPNDSLSSRYQCYLNHPQSIIHAGITLIPESSNPIYIPPISKEEIIPFLSGHKQGFGLNAITLLFPRDILTKIGYKSDDPSIFPHEDYEYGLRIFLNFSITQLNHNVYFYEKHPTSHSDRFGTSPQSSQKLSLLESSYLQQFQKLLKS